MSIERMRKRLAADRASFIEPCLPSPAPNPPAGLNWIHEVKHDGFRLMARRDPRGHPADHPQGQRLDAALSAGGRGREPPQGAVLPDRRRGVCCDERGLAIFQLLRSGLFCAHKEKERAPGISAGAQDWPSWPPRLPRAPPAGTRSTQEKSRLRFEPGHLPRNWAASANAGGCWPAIVPAPIADPRGTGLNGFLVPSVESMAGWQRVPAVVVVGAQVRRFLPDQRRC
jgi:hypothetical protein